MSSVRQRARQALIAYNALLGPLLAVAFIASGNSFLAIPAILFGHAFWMYSTLVPHCAWFGEVVTHVRDIDGSASASSVWLTIDDGPHPEDTPALLDLLDEFGARATFFFIGRNAAANPDLVREVIARGHGLGNHTMTHPHFRYWAYGPAALRREVTACRELLRSLSGRDVRIFRAPAGLKNPFLQRVLERDGVRLIGWSSRGLDGIRTDRDEINARIRTSLRPGGIVLVHEGRADESGQRLAPDILRSVLEELRARGLRAELPGQGATAES